MGQPPGGLEWHLKALSDIHQMDGLADVMMPALEGSSNTTPMFVPRFAGLHHYTDPGPFGPVEPASSILAVVETAFRRRLRRIALPLGTIPVGPATPTEPAVPS